MRTSTDVFHLAVPATDLDEAQRFYVELLGCSVCGGGVQDEVVSTGDSCD